MTTFGSVCSGIEAASVAFGPDGPRYKALGNSWAVSCVAWIARRIAAALRESALPTPLSGSRQAPVCAEGDIE